MTNRAEYYAEWRERNREALREYRRLYREKNRERIRASQAKYRAKHADKCAIAIMDWQSRNKDRIQAVRTIRRHKNPSVSSSAAAKRRAAKLQATPSWADADAIQAVYDEALRKTSESGIPHEVDHFFPLMGKTVCGLHVACNLRVLTVEENRRKGNKMPVDLPVDNTKT